MFRISWWKGSMWAIVMRSGFAYALCIVSYAAMGQSAEPKVPPGNYRITGRVTGRVSLPATTGSLIAGQPNEIPLVLHGFAVHSVDIDTSYRDENGQLMPSDKDESSLALLHHPDGSAYVVTVPPELGSVNVDVTVDFMDGKMERVSFDANVGLPSEGLKRLFVVSPGAAGTIYMDLSPDNRTAKLVPMGILGDATDSVHIPVDLVKFKLIAPRGKSASVSVNSSNGEITAVHLGHTLILTTYKGSSALTCINVQQSAEDGSDRTICSELVPPGMVEPASGYENAGPPPKIKVRPQQ